MVQYIKTINYNSFTTNHVFNCFCSGTKLSYYEAIELGLVTQQALDSYQYLTYNHNWYAIKPGDKIKVLSFNNWKSNIYTFTIPKSKLPNPPTTILELSNESLEEYIHYFTKHCSFELN